MTDLMKSSVPTAALLRSEIRDRAEKHQPMTVTLPGVVVGLLREATGITDPVKAAHALADDAIERRLRLHAIEALAEASSYVEANPPYNTSQAMMLTKTLVAKAQKKRAAKKH